MEIKTENDVLSIEINGSEWRDVFIMNDGEYIDVFVGSDNIDVLFPGWREYVNPDNILPYLNCDDVERFTKLNLSFDETVDSDKEGEGTYDITGFDISPAIDNETDEMIVVGAGDELDQIMMITIYIQ